MAYRYLRATGNWNGAVWAATSGGVAGSAATPTASDYVFIQSNYTVSLTANAEAQGVSQTNGRLNLNSYKLSLPYYLSAGNSNRTLDLGSGILDVDPVTYFTGGIGNLSFEGSNMNLISGSSLVTFRTWSISYAATFITGGLVFNDVQINLGNVGSTSINITGSPTFRSLIIQSKNSAAHTVNFDNNATITLDKLVLIGSSPSNRLKISEEYDSSDSVQFTFNDNATVYGQNVNMWAGRSYPENPTVPLYIGSNSTHGSMSTSWLLQDPPKISTLVDPLTTAPGSNPNWKTDGWVEGDTTGADGGGYLLLDSAYLASSDTFDAVGSSLLFEVSSIIGSDLIRFKTHHAEHPLSEVGFYRFSVSTSGTYLLERSPDGSSWYTITTTAVRPELYRSMRIAFVPESGLPPVGRGDSTTIGSINPSLAIDIDTNSVFSSVSISTPSISRTASLSVQGHGVGTSMSTPDIQSVIVLDADSIGTSTSISEPSMVLIKGVLANSMSIGVSVDNLDLLLKAGILPDNMEIVTASSIPSISGNIFIFTDDMLVGLNEDEVSVTALRNMDVDVMSIMPAILATAVQIGYPTSDISADNIYAIGSMREGEYGIATINNNQIYEVVEQDAI